jgi:hypothetical protein
MTFATPKAFFFDGWPSELPPDLQDRLCIALTPESAHELQEKGLPYLVPEDFCPLKEQAEISDVFYPLFKKWLEYLNSHLKSYLPDLVSEEFNPVWPFAFQLHLVIDSWFNQTFILDKVFQVLKQQGVGEIVWHGDSTGVRLEDDFLYPSWSGESLYSTCASSLAAKHGLKFAFLETGPPPSIPGKASQFIKKIKFTRICNRLKLEWKWWQLTRRRIFNNHSRDHKLIYTFKHQVPHVFLTKLKQNKFIIRKIKINTTPKEILKIDQNILQKSFEVFGNFNKISIPFENYLNQFLESCVSAIIQVAGNLEKKNISPDAILFSQDHVKFPYNCVNEFFRMNGIPRGTLFHGDSFYLCNYWDICEMQYADLYLVTNQVYLKTLSALYKNITYFSTDIRYRNIKRGNEAPKFRSPGLRKKILYLPTILRGANTRFFKSAVDYPQAWYYRIQRLIIDWLVDNNYFAIYKAFPGDGARNPILFSKKNHPNLEISTQKFIDLFGSFDLMITDYPSTGMLECIYAGVPCASLYPVELPISSYAGVLIDKVLFPFEHMGEIPPLLEKIMKIPGEELLEPVKDIFPAENDIRERNDREIFNFIRSLLSIKH